MKTVSWFIGQRTSPAAIYILYGKAHFYVQYMYFQFAVDTHNRSVPQLLYRFSRFPEFKRGVTLIIFAFVNTDFHHLLMLGDISDLSLEFCVRPQ